ncbi:MAG: hypothetical protein COB38_10790 [Gammaproteobacteria bacterium]|nr:MAG: hypothetical protein COB38_10790 [Gammaproteobacteria bacterium]
MNKQSKYINKTIYYIEDDDMSQILMSAFLKDNYPDYNVKTFDLVRVGKSYIEANGFPTIVITDYKMPAGEDDGEFLIRWMESIGFDNYIAWTGNSDELKQNLHEFDFYCVEKHNYKKLTLVLNKILIMFNID